MTSLPVPTTDGPSDITATLRALGMIEPASQQDFYRARINGTSFELDEDIYPSNQRTKEPAFIGRILEAPVMYQGVYLTQEDADTLDRSYAGDKYCKSHLNTAQFPNEGGKYAEDGTDCNHCPIRPFSKKEDSPLPDKKKCQQRADIFFKLCDTEGNELDPRIWVVSLSSTGVMELRGTRKDPEKGWVTDLNFMHRLAALGIAQADIDPTDTQAAQGAIGNAALALAGGGVIAEFRLISTKSQDGSRGYSVVSMNPILITEPTGEDHQLAAATSSAVKNVTPATDATPDDDLPF